MPSRIVSDDDLSSSYANEEITSNPSVTDNNDDPKVEKYPDFQVVKMSSTTSTQDGESISQVVEFLPSLLTQPIDDSDTKVSIDKKMNLLNQLCRHRLQW